MYSSIEKDAHNGIEYNKWSHFFKWTSLSYKKAILRKEKRNSKLCKNIKIQMYFYLDLKIVFCKSMATTSSVFVSSHTNSLFICNILIHMFICGIWVTDICLFIVIWRRCSANSLLTIIWACWFCVKAIPWVSNWG